MLKVFHTPQQYVCNVKTSLLIEQKVAERLADPCQAVTAGTHLRTHILFVQQPCTNVKQRHAAQTQSSRSTLRCYYVFLVTPTESMYAFKSMSRSVTLSLHGRVFISLFLVPVFSQDLSPLLVAIPHDSLMSASASGLGRV